MSKEPGSLPGNAKATATKFEPQRAKQAGSERRREVDWAEEQDNEEFEELDESAWQRRAQARLRQIHIGKARPEYRRYVHEVLPECRTKSQPSTPDPYDRVSKRQFDRALGAWRRQLHDFDTPGQWTGAAHLLNAIDSEEKERRGAYVGNKTDRHDREKDAAKRKSGGGRHKVASSSSLTEPSSSSTGGGSPPTSVADWQNNQLRIPISLADGLGTETPPPRPRAQPTESLPTWGPVQWMQGMQQRQWMTMETPQKQSMWLIPAARCESLSNETWLQNFQNSSCGPSMGTATVPEELPGTADSHCGYSSPRNTKESVPVNETPNLQTPRRGLWVTETPSPNQEWAYQQNPLVDEGDMSHYGANVPPLPQFSVSSHGPTSGFSSESGDGNSAADTLFPGFSSQNFQFPQQPQQCAFQGLAEEFQQQDLEGQANRHMHIPPLAYYSSQE